MQFGGALAATLVPAIGAAGLVTLRLLIGTVILVLVARPRLHGHDRHAWATVVLFGLALGAMNWSFYASLGRLPIGVAVTIEFIGPLVLTVALSRRVVDLVAVLFAAAGGRSSRRRSRCPSPTSTCSGWDWLCGRNAPGGVHRRRRSAPALVSPSSTACFLPLGCRLGGHTPVRAAVGAAVDGGEIS